MFVWRIGAPVSAGLKGLTHEQMPCDLLVDVILPGYPIRLAENSESALAAMEKEIPSKHLLLDTTDTIGAIAHQVGFKDQSYFSRVFHKVTGMSPQIFRETS